LARKQDVEDVGTVPTGQGIHMTILHRLLSAAGGGANRAVLGMMRKQNNSRLRSF
jgi:hypothetical protein